MSRPNLLLSHFWVHSCGLCGYVTTGGHRDQVCQNPKGRAELARSSFTGPTPHLTLQQESCAPPHSPFTMGVGELRCLHGHRGVGSTPRLKGVVPAAWTMTN